jgi:hypothetical protein
VVEYFSHNPKIESSKPTTGSGREKITKRAVEYWFCTASTVVQHKINYPEIETLKNPNASEREKITKRVVEY